MRKITTSLAGLAVLAVLAPTAVLASCTDSAPETAPATSTPATTSLEGAVAPHKLWEREHTLRNGQRVVCLQANTGGLDCNWSGLEYGGEK